MQLDRRAFTPQKPQPRPPYLMWSYFKISPGHSLRGFVAGPGIAVTVHWVGCSKPCRSAMTGGALPCEACGSGVEKAKRKRLITYLPLWDAMAKPRVITASESISQAALDLEFGTWIEALRTNGQRDPLRLRLPPSSESQRCPEGLLRRGPQDITEWLLHLWDDPVLASHLRQAAVTAEQNNDSPTVPSAVDSSPAMASPPSTPTRSNNGNGPTPARLEPPADPAAVRAKLDEWKRRQREGEGDEAEQQPAKIGRKGKRRK